MPGMCFAQLNDATDWFEMAAHSDAKKARAAKDCLHYCYPGPSDSWAVALYNLLLNNPRYAAAP